MTLMTLAFCHSLLQGAIIVGVPLLLVGLGEQISEKAGVLNIGLEGMMLTGACVGFLAALWFDSSSVGLLAGAGAGICTAMLMVIFSIILGANQIVTGIAITLASEGGTALVHYFELSRTYQRIDSVMTFRVPYLHDIPFFGVVMFDQPAIVYLAFFCVPIFLFIYRHTCMGLHLKAAGDRPEGLDVVGVGVYRTRIVALIITGCMAGTGGAFMSIVSAGVFAPFMTQGNGFIGIVLAMMSRGRPLWVLYGALLFGCCLSLTTALQVTGVNIPVDIIQMIPYAAVMAVLCFRPGQLPIALGSTYQRGHR